MHLLMLNELEYTSMHEKLCTLHIALKKGRLRYRIHAQFFSDYQVQE